MKKFVFVFSILIFIFSACKTAETEDVASTTPTVSLIVTSTSTSNITPLPTIPTFTPTFDVSRIVTVTSVEKAECPKENPEIIPDFPNCDNTGCSGGPYHEATLQYLNAGGTIDKLERKKWGTIQDLTGDGIKEVARSDIGLFFVYGCQEGKFEVFFRFEGTQQTPYLDHIIDLNNNNLPELIISNYERRAFHSINILEWNGKEFHPLIERSFISYSINPTGDLVTYNWLGGNVLQYNFIDINRDGFQEIVAINEIPYGDPSSLSSGLPWRNQIITLSWDGKHYSIVNIEYSSPQYQFQSIQDADTYVLKKNYEQAIVIYQSAIFDKKLDWWSKERKEFESQTTINMWFQNAMKLMVETATPFPTLLPITPDPSEYPSLTSYAYYRIMLIQLLQGQEAEANQTYQTLKDTLANDIYAKPYIEMTTAFLEAYHVSQKMYDGCAAAIQYAVEHPEILIPLGSDYHGSQSKIYKPEDVCPFR